VLDAQYLREVARLADLVGALWISDHLAFTAAAGIDLGHLNPIPLTEKMLSRVEGKVEEIQQVAGRRFLLENITSHLQLAGEMSEPAFLNKLCERTGCGVLLDITNLYVNSRNHHFDPMTYIHELDLTNVKQFHLIGYSCQTGVLQDDHGSGVQKELLDLLADVNVQKNSSAPVLVEWDRNFPTYDQLEVNLKNINEVMSGADRSTGQTVVVNIA
jgi:uncharacterized protein (UPF0276 family)